MNIVSKIHQEYLKRKFAKKLLTLKNIHIGERCFLIGNGPSLKYYDLDRLKDEYTFASNKIYSIFNKTLWRPTYYASQDELVIDEIKDRFTEISKECEACFFNGNIYRSYSKDLKNTSNVYFFKSYTSVNEKNEAEISEDITKGINNGFTVTFAMIQIAIYMGFNEIYLLGCDNNYSRSLGLDNKIIIENGIEDYFDGVEKSNNKVIPMPAHSENSYKAARRYAEKHGIKIYNATRGGKLEIFERIDFDSIRL